MPMTPQAPILQPPFSMQSPSPTKAAAALEKPGKQWNTTNIPLRLTADTLSAAAASLLVSPIIATIDRSIVIKASTGLPLRQTLRSSLTALLRPHTFLKSRPFLLIYTLYFSTYLTANTVDTLTSTVSNKPAGSVTSNTGKFVATSAVNMSLCVYKDSQFARMFGSRTSSAASAIPRLSYALFAARDSLTIFASFNLPPVLSTRLETLQSNPSSIPAPLRQHLTFLLSTEKSRLNTAQFLAPAGMQLFSTPLHLLGLDLYNRVGSLGIRERMSRVMRDWGVSAFARMGRIVPAFGVGGIVNGSMRRGLIEKYA